MVFWPKLVRLAWSLEREVCSGMLGLLKANCSWPGLHVLAWFGFLGGSLVLLALGTGAGVDPNLPIGGAWSWPSPEACRLLLADPWPDSKKVDIILLELSVKLPMSMMDMELLRLSFMRLLALWVELWTFEDLEW